MSQPESGQALRLRLLGPLDVVVGETSLDLGGPRQRVVLAMLALNANRVVSVDALVDAIWEDAPPTTARGQIQISVSALRKLFRQAGQPDLVLTRPPGYLLHTTQDMVDYVRFDALLAVAKEQSEAGRLDEAATTLRQALGLWRGPALSDVTSVPVRRAALLWDDRRLVALEERLRAELALGRHRELVGELTALVDEHPLREGPYALLMLALYRAGRQAEALAVARRARTRLVEEIGVDPGSELRTLESQILNSDPALDLAEAEREVAAPIRVVEPAPITRLAPTPWQLPASIGDFTGRTEDIERIKLLLTEARQPGSYAVPIVAVSGKGGVGKSTLATRAAHELAPEFPDGLLYANLAAAEHDGGVIGVLGRFLRALGQPAPVVQDDLRDVIDRYRSRLAGKRVLVVLDDAADEAQVLPLVPGSPTCAVITTSRARLSTLPGARWVDLDVFDTDRSLELLGRIIGAERVQSERDSALKLVALCGGLPLALRIAGARLASQPTLPLGWLVHRLADEGRRLDEFAHHGLALRATIGLTYAALDPQAQRLFALFALVRADDFAGWTAAALLDTGLPEAEHALDRLVEAQVLDPVSYPGEPLPRYRLHDLIRLYAEERLAGGETETDRRAALTRLAGGLLTLAEVVHRREFGGDHLVLHGRAPRWQPPGTDFAEQIGSSLSWWDRERGGLLATVRQAADAGLPELAWDLAFTTIGVFESKGCFDNWQDTVETVGTATERAGDRRGLAAMRYALGTLHLGRQRFELAQRCFGDALSLFDESGDKHGRALVLRSLALIEQARGDAAAMLARYTESLAGMRAVDDRVGAAQVLAGLAKCRLDRGESEVAEELLDEATEICRTENCPRVQSQVDHQLGELYLATDRIELARRVLHRSLRLARDLDDRIGEAHALYGLGVVRHREGRLDNAERTLTHAQRLADQICERLLAGQSRYALAEVALAKGEPDTAHRHLDLAVPAFDELGAALWQARALILTSELATVEGDAASAGQDADRAAQVLAEVGSGESRRLLDGLTRLKGFYDERRV